MTWAELAEQIYEMSLMLQKTDVNVYDAATEETQ